MKLLLDENLSRRIIPFLQTAFPGSSQVALLELESASDSEIGQYAKTNGFVIVSRDSDFQERSLVAGHHRQETGTRHDAAHNSVARNVGNHEIRRERDRGLPNALRQGMFCTRMHRACRRRPHTLQISLLP